MTAKDRAEKRDFARLLYLQGEEQKTIAKRIGISEVTISKWANDGGWQELRAAQNITRPELVNKILRSIDRLLDKALSSDEVDAGFGKQLKSFSDAIKAIDSKANVVDVIESFIAFGRWMEYRMTIDSEVTPELLKKITHYQDLYIATLLAEGSK
jgi:transcriptional regulator with XRE-family HTH domain